MCLTRPTGTVVSFDPTLPQVSMNAEYIKNMEYFGVTRKKQKSNTVKSKTNKKGNSFGQNMKRIVKRMR